MTIQKRNIAIAIIFSIVTCGIYSYYWIAKMNDEVNSFAGRTNATSGGMVVLFSILTCGIYSYYWLYKMGEAVDQVRAQYGRPNNSSSIVYLLLGIFGLGIVSLALMQNELNQMVGE